MKHISIFSTAKLYEIDMVRITMKKAGIPHFIQEENISGLKTAFPAAPSPGIGISWSLMVAENAIEDAKKILSDLQLHPENQPGVWDFTSDSDSRNKYKKFAWAALMIIGLVWIIVLLSFFFRT